MTESLDNKVDVLHKLEQHFETIEDFDLKEQIIIRCVELFKELVELHIFNSYPYKPEPSFFDSYNKAYMTRIELERFIDRRYKITK